MIRRPPKSTRTDTLLPDPPLVRSLVTSGQRVQARLEEALLVALGEEALLQDVADDPGAVAALSAQRLAQRLHLPNGEEPGGDAPAERVLQDRKSTRLNSSH